MLGSRLGIPGLASDDLPDRASDPKPSHVPVNGDGYFADSGGESAEMGLAGGAKRIRTIDADWLTS
jgi:hypothetical protein